MGSTYSAAGVSLSGSPIMGEAQMFIPSQPSGPDCETVAGAGRPCVAAELTGTPAATTGVRLSPTENDLLSKIRSQRNGAWLGPTLRHIPVNGGLLSKLGNSSGGCASVTSTSG